MLGVLQAMSDEHFHTNPDEINWADVGNISRLERPPPRTKRYAENGRRILEVE
jgi:hypothetical protein